MPSVKQYDKTHDREMVIWPSVPVFYEHTDDGDEYTRDVLEAMAKNNNDRIERSGDYCPIVAWHTPLDGDQSSQPPIIGYAGPFWVRKFENTSLFGIYCRFAIFAEAENYAKEHPRRSVEVWADDDLMKRFIDPIAVLGPETPRLDLGLLHQYSRPTKGKKFYELSSMAPAAASTAGASNSFVPDHADSRKQYGENAMALSPEDLDQIGQIVSQMVDAKFAEQGDGMGEDPLVDDVPMDDEAPIGEEIPVGEELPPDFEDGDAMPEEEAAMAKEMYSCASAKYSLASSKPNLTGAKQYFAAMPVEDRNRMDQFMRSSNASADQKKLYSRIRGAAPTPAGDSTRRYQREAEDMKARYQKAVSERDKLRGELAKSKSQVAEANKKARYSKYDSKLRDKELEGYRFDFASELDFVLGLTDEQADNHIETRVVQYARMPHREVLPIEQTRSLATTNRSKHYAKAATDHVVNLRRKAVEAGHSHESVNFKKVFEWCSSNETDQCPKLEDILS